MELAVAGVPLSFEVTYDRDDLPVGMSVYDDTASSPVLVQGPNLMTLVGINTYRGKFTAQENKSYVIIKAVYTDSSLNTLNNDYRPGSESIFAQSPTTAQVPSQVVGYVENSGDILGLVDCN